MVIIDPFDPRFFYGSRLFKSAPKAPAAPDPVATAAAQTASNKETALWNASLQNVNQITPYGNLTYKQTAGGPTYNQAAYDAALSSWNAKPSTSSAPMLSLEQWSQKNPSGTNPLERYGQYVQNYQNSPETVSRGAMPQLADFKTGESAPQFTSTINLSPESQKLLDTQMRSENALASLGEGQLGRITDAVSTPYSYAGLSAAPTNEDINALSQRGQEAIMSRLNPQFAQDEEAMRTRLINQGIGQGSEAYNREMNTFNQAKNDARTQAILQGQAYGAGQQAQQLGLRNQGIQEYNALRNAPLNEYTAMTSGQQIQNPNFQNTNYSGAAPVDYANLVNNQYQSQLGAYNSKVAGQNSTMGALFGLGGSFLGGPAGGSIAGKLFGI